MSDIGLINIIHQKFMRVKHFPSFLIASPEKWDICASDCCFPYTRGCEPGEATVISTLPAEGTAGLVPAEGTAGLVPAEC